MDLFLTPFGQVLKSGLYTCGLTLQPRQSRGSVLLDEWFEALTAETDPTQGQFVQLAGGRASTAGAQLEYRLAVQGVRKPLPSVQAAAQGGELFEILSVWVAPEPLCLPHFELTAKVGDWFCDSLEPGRQPYQPRMMTLRALNAVQGRLALPGDRFPPFYEID